MFTPEENEIKTPEENESYDYAQAIKDLKANTVDKAEYEKLKSENSKMLKAFVNGEYAPAGAETNVTPEQEFKQVVNNLYGKHCAGMTNIDYIKQSLKLRELNLSMGRPDDYGLQGAQLAQTLQACVDDAHDDPSLFNALIKRTVR